jgi:tRNA(fMet)-specific endonuclease VapC
MPRRLLDTSILVSVLRSPRGREADRLRTIDAAGVCTSVVVAGELRFGAARMARSQGADKSVEALLDAIDVEPLAPPVDEFYGRLRARREAQGLPMGANDLWIAAHAMALGCVLVSADKDFDAIEGLDVERWPR